MHGLKASKLSRLLLRVSRTKSKYWRHLSSAKPVADALPITSSDQAIKDDTCWATPVSALNLEYISDFRNWDRISENVARRKCNVDLQKLRLVIEELNNAKNNDKRKILEQQLGNLASALPNSTHPDVVNLTDNRVIELRGTKKAFSFKPLEMQKLFSNSSLIRTENLGNLTGSRTYYLTGELSLLENALIRFTVNKLRKVGFKFVSVPDLLHPGVIEGSGMQTKGERTQVYSLTSEHGPVCLSGTAEMALNGMFSNSILPLSSLPQKVAAVSRCFRAEISQTAEERGIYRVHQFNKVEMFVVTSNEQNGGESEQALDELLSIQRGLFDELDLHYQILDMAAHELGRPAYRKFDVETWMYGRNMFGEISSASNCTDYQSRRLSIKYKTDQDDKFCHTVNGTACAVPRLIIALTEQNQQRDKSVVVPQVLKKYMNDISVIKPKKSVVKWIRSKS